MSQESQTTTDSTDVNSHQNIIPGMFSGFCRKLNRQPGTRYLRPVSVLSKCGRSNASAIPSAPGRLLKLTFEAFGNKKDMRNLDPTECLLCERKGGIRKS